MEKSSLRSDHLLNISNNEKMSSIEELRKALEEINSLVIQVKINIYNYLILFKFLILFLK